MSLTNIEQVMPVKLAQALANPLFPALDSPCAPVVISALTSWIITHF
jgi:chromosome condensin MukBEF MukE localization factor